MALIITHSPNPEYSKGWDRIFGDAASRRKKEKDSVFKKVIRAEIEGMRKENEALYQVKVPDVE